MNQIIQLSQRDIQFFSTIMRVIQLKKKTEISSWTAIDISEC